MDWQSGLWRCEGRADAFELTGRQAEIVEVIREMGSLSVGDISTAIGWDRGSTYRTCVELCGLGMIVRMGEGWGKVKYGLRGGEKRGGVKRRLL